MSNIQTYTIREISEATGISVQTLRARCKRNNISSKGEKTYQEIQEIMTLHRTASRRPNSRKINELQKRLINDGYSVKR